MEPNTNPFQESPWPGRLIWAIASIAIGVIALLIAIWALLSGQAASEALIQNTAIKLADANAAIARNAVQNEQLVKDLRDAQSRVAQLEGKLAEFQSQRIALEEMYRDLARAPDDWLLAELEQTLNIASRELVLAGNVKAALIALQSVDQRLAKADKLQVVQLRRALTQDTDHLKALPQIDTTGISLKLDNIATLASTLPLLLPDKIEALDTFPHTSDAEKGGLARLGRDMWNELKQLVRIRELDSGDSALLSPQQSFFLRENFKLRLLSARNALLMRDEVHYKNDLNLARAMLVKYFDPKAKVNINTIATLKQLSESPVSIATPDITASLAAIRAMRAARERPVR